MNSPFNNIVIVQINKEIEKNMICPAYQYYCFKSVII